ncbi:hypothetical protein PUNSTDRAFT_122987 [Punctularia strigosozonata HHB-11173 SS5]|uniref:Mitochondrial import inner membrane translocase subunit TIM50 n=1 Tax=Punctularia strigosozonata (strain HHB-11173) TaxID=741275 RepID=R7S1S9_PUNST|nr:uncharacterized protein PUNSTDRAFT_122987 [Punctularia strigosozonata HHB-11173 SS5]EIN04178.1 hypothetical protein PUNSTDRAFT_122987 [Punctularia strigosozonata HHB-11173 SS5]
MGKRRRHNRDNWSNPSSNVHGASDARSFNRAHDSARVENPPPTYEGQSSAEERVAETGHGTYAAFGDEYGTEVVARNTHWETSAIDPYYDYYDASTVTHQKRSYHDYAYSDRRPTPPRAPSPPLTRPPQIMVEQRPRSPTPPPPPRSPSPTYLTLATVPTMTLPSPAASRKLLILDLNGSLLLRSRFASRHPPGLQQQQGPQVRKVHRRPYLETFVNYLFASDTRSWLDVMVWSSAQPHSVADMVDKCFGERKHELIAVWARDTLGLSRADYNRKSQTTKDLAKPWKLVPWFPRHEPAAPVSKASQESGSQDEEGGIPGLALADADADIEVFPEYHSALTTVLLDDSPLKARLQPWNHVCLKEYVQAMRNHDLKALEQEALKKTWMERREQDAHIPAEAQSGSVDGEDAQSSSASVPDAEPQSPRSTTPPLGAEGGLAGGSKRKRPSRKEKRDAEIIARFASGEPPVEEAEFDLSLLAVIGILDAIKWESNVAAWIREGGLWGASRPDAAISRGTDEMGLNHLSEQLRAGSVATTPAPFPGNDAETSATASAVAAPVWFDNPEVVRYWAARGREACEALGIEVAHGIEG